MTDEKKLVIKINYGANANERSTGKLAEPQMVTEWNIKRIVVAFAVLALIVAIGIYLWAGQKESIDAPSVKSTAPQTTKENKDTALLIDDKAKELEKVSEESKKQISKFEESGIKNRDSEEMGKGGAKSVVAVNREEVAVSGNKEQDELESQKSQESKESQKIAPRLQEKKDKNKNEQPSEEDDSLGKSQVEVEPVVAKMVTADFPKGLTRAVITSSIWKKEPIDVLTSPIKINRDQARSIFYFTELKGMKGKTVYHVWKHNGKVKFRKKIGILGNRWRASTSKLMNYTSLGNWSVQLTNSEGKVLYEKSFKIIEA